MKVIQFNINDYCSVILTGTGAAVLNRNNADSNARFAHLGIQLTCKTDYKKGDTFKDQFWSMFQLFGAHMQLCMEAPFDSWQITLHTS